MRAQRASHDDDLLGRDASVDEPHDLAGDDFGLGALAARLEQADDRPRINPLGRRLEQAPLEVMQRLPGLRRVVLLQRRQLLDAAGERAERLHDLGPGTERRALRLVGERHRHLDPDDPGQRLDRVPLDRRQVVEAVHEHRRLPPAAGLGAQCVDRPPRVQLGVDPAAAIELAHKRAVQRADVVRVVGAPRVLGGPGR